MRIPAATLSFACTSRIAGFEASHEIALSLNSAAPRSGNGSLQLRRMTALPVPTTTARGPCGALGDVFGRSLAMAMTSGPERSRTFFSGMSVQSAAPVMFATPYDLSLDASRSTAGLAASGDAGDTWWSDRAKLSITRGTSCGIASSCTRPAVTGWGLAVAKKRMPRVSGIACFGSSSNTRSSSSAIPNGASASSSPAGAIPFSVCALIGLTATNKLPPSSRYVRSRFVSSFVNDPRAPAMTATAHPLNGSCASAAVVSTVAVS